jgi:hypothetical protein
MPKGGRRATATGKLKNRLDILFEIVTPRGSFKAVRTRQGRILTAPAKKIYL